MRKRKLYSAHFGCGCVHLLFKSITEIYHFCDRHHLVPLRVVMYCGNVMDGKILPIVMNSSGRGWRVEANYYDKNICEK